MLTRRVFLQSSTAAALASRLFGAPADATKPNPELENLGAVALREAKKLKASYCDIRIIRYRRQQSERPPESRARHRQDPRSAGRLRRRVSSASACA